MSTTGDVVSVVESAYDLESDTKTWLAGVLDAAGPLLDRGLGVAAYVFDARGQHLDAPIVVSNRIDPSQFGTIAKLLMNAPRVMLERTYRSPKVCATASEATGLGERLAEFEPWTRYAAPLGFVDVIGVKVAGPEPDQGCMLHGLLDRVGRTSSAEQRMWGRVAAHVSAGLRLRWALESGNDANRGQTEAILKPNGGLEHAERPAESASRREALRAAVHRLEKARGPARSSDPMAALDLWKGLVAGRWTLVDRYESDGRRYLVARRNDPDHRDPRGLTPRERQVAHLVVQGHSNKLVAYTLGLSLSTVATHVAAAKTKLGASSRMELIALLSQSLVGPGGPPEK